ncbi:Uncharacterised protein [Mycobacterium tuberculosis]|nr:Uncharacterised protein [Mycobacterium tuberculosis]
MVLKPGEACTCIARVTRLVVLTARYDHLLAIDLVRPVIMVRIIEIIAERARVDVSLQRKGNHVAPVGSGGEVEQTDPGRCMGRKNGMFCPDLPQAGMEKYPLFGFLVGLA